MMALPDVGTVAALIGDPTRAAILTSLLDGRARAAGELAACAAVSPQSASNHLARLLEGGLLRLEAQGRHRYYRLAGGEVARALEALALLSPVGRRPGPVEPSVPEGLRFARTCYDHLAGTLGVGITEALLGRGFLVEDGEDYRTTPRGEEALAGMGIDAGEVRLERRSFARRCLDWSERRHHLAGALGARMLTGFLQLGWMVRVPGGRAVRLTIKGRRALERELRLRPPAS